MCSDTSSLMSRTVVHVESTGEGIREGDIADDIADSDGDSIGEDSIVNENEENEEIWRLERLDFESDVHIDTDLDDDN